jgi:adenylosuccinate synthase
MGATVIIGGQFGKEGKSKVAFLWGLYNGCDIAIKIGGNEVSPAEFNKRYVVEDDQSYHFEMIPPTSNSDDDVVYVFPSGSYIHIDNLIDEIKIRGLTPDKIIVDPNAWVITQENEDGISEWKRNCCSDHGENLLCYRRWIFSKELGSFEALY